ncbi:hypothetical protein AB0L40_05975 [Patulibacter sp. NPDC049589]
MPDPRFAGADDAGLPRGADATDIDTRPAPGAGPTHSDEDLTRA